MRAVLSVLREEVRVRRMEAEQALNIREESEKQLGNTLRPFPPDPVVDLQFVIGETTRLARRGEAATPINLAAAAAEDFQACPGPTAVDSPQQNSYQEGKAIMAIWNGVMETYPDHDIALHVLLDDPETEDAGVFYARGFLSPALAPRLSFPLTGRQADHLIAIILTTLPSTYSIPAQIGRGHRLPFLQHTHTRFALQDLQIDSEWHRSTDMAPPRASGGSMLAPSHRDGRSSSQSAHNSGNIADDSEEEQPYDGTLDSIKTQKTSVRLPLRADYGQWSTIQAFRELIQNQRDAIIASFNISETDFHVQHEGNLFKIPVPGPDPTELAGYISHSGPADSGLIEIVNHRATLQPKNFDFGLSGKRGNLEQAGIYSEGLKIAILTLLRLP
ncbi:uncharacterized protein E0L32_011284 [Thyridium curvatum]|uniref:Uncharacterized protein n=1 Tax=Thyridium curvatum TaxID=1093900 RepID=A0A507BQF1_9PEZI|nr:uncharacterized protein E0L32_011284 [Thyridium curvatum]TPX19040.1 hypothetical protein E0L32_011284 [Thyridium curvatum]